MRRAKKVGDYCIPTAVAYVENGDPDEVAVRLLKLEPKSRGWFSLWSAAGVMGMRHRYIFVPKRLRITLAAWLREDGRDAIVVTGSHAHVVEGGEVVWDNGMTKRRGKVEAFVLTREPETA